MGRKQTGLKGTGIPKKGKWNDRVYSQVRESVMKRSKQQRVEDIITEA